MKKLLLAVILFPLFSQAQLFGGKNIIKTNLSSIVLKNYSFTYERCIYKNLSISLNYRFMPKGNIPFQSTVSNLFKDSKFDFNKFQIGDNAFTPEVRLYSHKNMRGFYVAGYARFASFDFGLPLNYSYTDISGNHNSTALFNGKVTSTSGGIMIGVQHTIFKKLTLDIWIIGAHFGSCNGNMLATFDHTLTTQEKQGLQNQINSIKTDPFKISGTVNNDNTATLVASGPWVGVRGLGLNLGFRF
jgi:hypothetical protein